jgi:hypothetical protein
MIAIAGYSRVGCPFVATARGIHAPVEGAVDDLLSFAELARTKREHM